MLKLENITYHIGDYSLENFTMELADREYLGLLGPSGSGKSVILEIISGLRIPETGRIILEGTDITKMPVQNRPIGLLFQDYALFPNMTVHQNIAYPLRINSPKKPNKTENPQKTITEQVQEIAQTLNISHLLQRNTTALSGGESQRVALARTLIRRPSVLLLDEPLSALDADLKATSLKLLNSLTNTGLSIIHVTHDPTEVQNKRTINLKP